MLVPKMDVGQRFFDAQYYGMWTMTAPAMLISPSKADNNTISNYCAAVWSSPVNSTTVLSPSKPCKSSEKATTFRKHIQFQDSPGKKLFRPWIDEDISRENSVIKNMEKSTSLNLARKFPVTPQFTGERNGGGAFRQMFTTAFNKVHELADNLTTTVHDIGDDEASKTTLELIATNLGKSVDGHRCIYCGKIYSRKYGLKIHLRTHTGFKPLKCKICNRPFGDPSNLNKHTRLHAESGAPLFQCHLCGKSLVRKRDLERHLNSRHPQEDVEIDVERL